MTTRCLGTARYARRCRRRARIGEVTCHLHAHQDVAAYVATTTTTTEGETP